MSVNVGTFSIGEIYVGSDKIVKAYVGSELVYQSALPVRTFRFKFSDAAFDPSTTLASANLTWTAVNASSGIWDAVNISTATSPYANLFKDLLSTTNMGTVRCELVEANTSDMTSAYNLFQNCSALTKIGKMDLSSVTITSGMCADCTKLTEFPDIDIDTLSVAESMFLHCNILQKVPDLGQLPNITNVRSMFQGCRFVMSGILAMYNILSTRITTVSNHRYCFTSCGSSTSTGSAELAQIPSGWK